MLAALGMSILRTKMFYLTKKQTILSIFVLGLNEMKMYAVIMTRVRLSQANYKQSLNILIRNCDKYDENVKREHFCYFYCVAIEILLSCFIFLP